MSVLVRARCLLWAAAIQGFGFRVEGSGLEVKLKIHIALALCGSNFLATN
jgi:hypothetical protein